MYLKICPMALYLYENDIKRDLVPAHVVSLIVNVWVEYKGTKNIWIYGRQLINMDCVLTRASGVCMEKSINMFR